jgi:protein SCO1/2
VSEPPPRAAVAPRLVWAFLILVLAGVTMLAARGWLSGRAPLLEGRAAPLPTLGEVPPFALVERSGRPLTRDGLRGSVWIADFVFTRCSGSCPMMASAMSRLQVALEDAPRVRLVSVSVDPEYDTPEVLREYAQGVAADSARWLWATGEKEAIFRLSREGFRLGIGEEGAEAADSGAGAVAADEILHSQSLVLVDAAGRIRGYYDGMDEAAVGRLIEDARRLARERRS